MIHILNSISIKRRIVEELQLKRTPNDIPVLGFTIAVTSQYGDIKQGTDFFAVVAWRHQATFISEHFKKGQAIIISGYLHNREYEFKGRKHTKAEIVVEKVDFDDKKDMPTVEVVDEEPGEEFA